MASYSEGTMTLSGDRDILDLVYVLCERIEDCADISDYDGDTDWIGHILKQPELDEGIFVEGCYKEGNNVVIQFRGMSTDGKNFAQEMSTGLGLTVKIEGSSDWDDKPYRCTCHPKKKGTPWILRTEDELDADFDDDDDFIVNQGNSLYGDQGSVFVSNARSSVKPLDLTASYMQQKSGVAPTVGSMDACAGPKEVEGLNRIWELMYTASCVVCNVSSLSGFPTIQGIISKLVCCAGSELEALCKGLLRSGDVPMVFVERYRDLEDILATVQDDNSISCNGDLENLNMNYSSVLKISGCVCDMLRVIPGWSSADKGLDYFPSQRLW